MFGFYVAALAALFGDVNAYWRMNCSPLMDARIDPIVSPGKVPGHVHSIVGSANTGINSTYETLFNARCTTCEIQDDMSAYWAPLLYYQFANGSLIEVPHDGSVAYYIGRGKNTTYEVFPPGFRMLSGNAGARSYDNKTLTYDGDPEYPGRPVSDRISWACLDVSGPSRETPYINRTDCSSGLRAQLHFQSCWNGVDLYKTDNSHVAYMSDIDNGVCPPTHPHHFIHLFLETLFAVNEVPKEPGGRFMLSMGDPTGFGYHGDFQNGWNITTLQDAIPCASAEGSFGVIDECPALVRSYVKNYPRLCPPRKSPVNETVTGLIPKLPGCINIVNGPYPANATDMSCPSSVKPPYVTPTADTVPIATVTPVFDKPYGNPGWTYVGCSNDTQGRRALQGAFYQDYKNMTWENCQNFCAQNNYKYAGVEYYDECYCDNYFYNNPQFGLDAKPNVCNDPCTGNITQACGAGSIIMIFNNTQFVPPVKPTTQAVSGKYVHKGCYIERSSGGRALANASTSSSTMTVNMCTKFCLGKKLKYAGIEYGQECYCGDRLMANGTAPQSECDMRCAGNTLKLQSLCGSGNRLDVYYSGTL